MIDIIYELKKLFKEDSKYDEFILDYDLKRLMTEYEEELLKDACESCERFDKNSEEDYY